VRSDQCVGLLRIICRTWALALAKTWRRGG
jgi:hypothetical protein